MDTSILTNFFEVLGAAATGTVQVISDIFGNLLSIFYQAPTDVSNGGFTLYGILVVMGVATPLVFWGINLITGAFKKSVKR